MPVSFLYPLAAFMAVVLLIPPARMLALRIGIVDEPGGRKQHDEPVPPIGGLVIFPVFIIASLLAGADVQSYGYLYIALIMIMVTGALDDALHISAWIKFFVQIAAALLVVIPGGAQLESLGNLFGYGEFYLGFMAVPFAVAAVTLLINAVNLMDGLDGLAAGKSFVMLSWLAAAGILSGGNQPVLEIGLLMAAAAGFLFYNLRHPLRKKASIFLGDAGSLGLGLVVGWFAIKLAQQPGQALQPIAAAWILALPIFDTCAQFYRRMREGRHPFSPDRGHFHHHFIQAGFSPRRTTLYILLLGLTLGGIGYGGILIGVSEFVLTGAWIALLFTHMALSRKPERYIRLIARLPGQRGGCG